MGRTPSIAKQVKDHLDELQALGENVSKHGVKNALREQAIAYAKEHPELPMDRKLLKDPIKRIYAFNARKTYAQWDIDFGRWAKGVTGKKWMTDYGTIDLINEYLKKQIDLRDEDGSPHYSASSIATMKSALANYYGFSSEDFIKTPKRERVNIKRSRKACARDAHYNPVTGKHAGYVFFCQHVGPRAKKEAESIRGSDLMHKEDQYYVHIKRGKGGKPRDALIVGTPEEVQQVVAMLQAAGDNKLFPKAPGIVDTHSLRADYVRIAYNQFARPIKEIPQRERYYCRKDMVGKVFDRAAMLKVSRLVGHNRICVIAGHYLWQEGITQ